VTMARRPAKRGAAADKKLTTYRAKRRFHKTPEPAGGSERRPVAGPMFVVQKHAASRLHYDFRLEIDGVLVSWAIPKGPSVDPAVKRLAARTEDHPIEYGDFEGIIPEGEYGGGAVIVWDTGTWQPEGNAADALGKGHIKFELSGKKLRGRFHLVRTRGGKPAGESWLFFKGKDAEARSDGRVPWNEKSVLSGRSIEDVRGAPERVWHSDRPVAEQAKKTSRARIRTAAAAASGAPAADLSGLIASLPAALPRGIPLSNLDKVLYPEQGLTKAALVAYYAAVSERMLPYLANRPLTLVRCPDGHHRHCFFQKHSKAGQPPAVHRVPIREESGELKDYMAVGDLAGLLGLVQLGALEIHTWGCRRDRVDRPDVLVFDLDPDEALPFAEVTDAAFEVRGQLAEFGLESFVKTTGGKGLHLVVPIERRTGWDEAKEFCHQLALAMTHSRRDRYVAVAGKARRSGRIFIDYLRNSFGASAIAPYSTRARDGARVSAPLTWEELRAGIDPGDFTVTSMPRRIAAQKRDPWHGYDKLKQSIKRRGSRRRAA
jgi:bifunctional non-homologous end joining protein LigD